MNFILIMEINLTSVNIKILVLYQEHSIYHKVYKASDKTLLNKDRLKI